MELILTLKNGPEGAQIFRALRPLEEGAMKRKRYTDEMGYSARQAGISYLFA
jgi:hypothetical protein